jgi:tetratricopeptide (TPR) repeat protein
MDCRRLRDYYFYSFYRPLANLKPTIYMEFAQIVPPQKGKDLQSLVDRLLSEGNDLLRKSKFDEAREKYLRLRGILSNYPGLWKVLRCIDKQISFIEAKILQANDEQNNALMKFRELLQSPSVDCQVHVAALVEEGMIYKEKLQPNRAMEKFKEALANVQIPDLRAWIYVEMAMLKCSLQGYTNEVSYYFEKALLENTDMDQKVTIHISYASALFEVDRQSALMQLNKAENACGNHCSKDLRDQIIYYRTMWKT